MKKFAFYLVTLFLAMPILTNAEVLFEDDTLPPPLLPPEVDLFAQASYGINSLSDYDGDDTETFEFNFGIEAHAATESNLHIAGELGVSSFGEDTITSQSEFRSIGSQLEEATITENITEFRDAHLGLRLRKPTNGKISMYGRIGASFWQVENTQILTDTLRADGDEDNGTAEAVADTTRTDDSGISLYLGVGSIYQLTNSFGASIEFQYNNNEITPIYTGSLGLIYSF